MLIFATYLGGLPGFKPMTGRFEVTPTFVVMSKGLRRPQFNIRRESVKETRIVTSEVDTKSRYTMTRIALLGVFALGAPKRKTEAHTLVEIELYDGRVAAFDFAHRETQVRLLLAEWLYPTEARISLAPPITGAA